MASGPPAASCAAGSTKAGLDDCTEARESSGVMRVFPALHAAMKLAAGSPKRLDLVVPGSELEPSRGPRLAVREPSSPPGACPRSRRPGRSSWIPVVDAPRGDSKLPRSRPSLVWELDAHRLLDGKAWVPNAGVAGPPRRPPQVAAMSASASRCSMSTPPPPLRFLAFQRSPIATLLQKMFCRG